MRTRIITFTFLLATSAFAARDERDFSTNRVVQGKLYNLAPLHNWLRDSEVQKRSRLPVAPRPLPEWEPIWGTVVFVSDEATVVQVREYRDKEFNRDLQTYYVGIQNYPRQKKTGEQFGGFAFNLRQTKNVKMNGGSVTARMYDFGVETNRAPIVVAAPPKPREPINAEKIVAFQKKRAAEGSAISQYDLAVRYLTGDGVEKDEAEARRLLKLSADQGYKPAIEKLKSLP